MNNPILGPDNAFFGANIPADTKTVRTTFGELPLGVTATGEVGLKVIVIGNASIGLNSLPTQPGASGTLYNNNGQPAISP